MTAKGIRPWGITTPAASPVGGWSSRLLRGIPSRFRHVVSQRSIRPAGPAYLMAGAIGAGLGLLLWKTSGVPWWMTAVAAPAAAWVASLGTALVGRSQAGDGLLTRLIYIANPDRAAARRARQREKVWRSRPFPAFGLPPDWTGERYLGVLDMRRDSVRSLELGHGDPDNEGAGHLLVRVARTDGTPHLSRTLATSLALECMEPPPRLSPRESSPRVAQRLREFISASEQRWQTTAIRVDGKWVPLLWLAEGPAWVAHCRVDGLLLTLFGRNLPLAGLQLVSVMDIGPYVPGSSQLGG